VVEGPPTRLAVTPGEHFSAVADAAMVVSDSRLPRGAPRGRSISPAGPSVSKRCFQEYSVCFDTFPIGAKSAAGRPLRIQMSRIFSRVSPSALAPRARGPDAGDSGGAAPSRFTRPRP
jgi:hypothetical protein